MEQSSGIEPTTKSQKRILEEATSRYQAAVSEELAEWLMDRGLSQEAASGARLGEVHDPAPGHQQFRGWLAIPYLDRNGKPLTMRFRRPDWYGNDRSPKYMSLTGDPARMYGVNYLHQAIANFEEDIHLCEGERDAILLNQLGYPAVALPGASSFQGRWKVMLAGFSRVFLWADGDDAGGRMVTALSKAMRQTVPIMLPRGQDVSELYVDGGREALEALLERWADDSDEEDE